jgi:diaminopimelate epimerase
MIYNDFYKYHALGNDYLVIDPNQLDIKLDANTIRTICHRHFGIGSDGILYGPVLDGGLFKLRIFNPDGSEAEKSGNGVRIFARYLWEAGYVEGKTFLIHTPGGIVNVRLLDDQAKTIQVEMGRVSFRSDLIPVAGDSRDVIAESLMLSNGQSFQVTCLTIGNPHCVIPLEQISRELTLAIGPLVENHPAFPNRINMQLLRVIDQHTIQIEIWERGAGYTLASGSSSCAAASAAYQLGLVDRQVKVIMPGGAIEIEIGSDGMVLMTGSVTAVAKGRFAPEFRETLYG